MKVTSLIPAIESSESIRSISVRSLFLMGQNINMIKVYTDPRHPLKVKLTCELDLRVD
jgi:hypothetical protein